MLDVLLWVDLQPSRSFKQTPKRIYTNRKERRCDEEILPFYDPLKTNMVNHFGECKYILRSFLVCWSFSDMNKPLEGFALVFGILWLKYWHISAFVCVKGQPKNTLQMADKKSVTTCVNWFGSQQTFRAALNTCVCVFFFKWICRCTSKCGMYYTKWCSILIPSTLTFLASLKINKPTGRVRTKTQ